jgi:hypothetical protein
MLTDTVRRLQFSVDTEIFSSTRSKTGFDIHPVSCPVDNRSCFSRGHSLWGTMLTTYLHLVPRFRMSGAIAPLLSAVFMARALIKPTVNLAFIYL